MGGARVAFVWGVFVVTACGGGGGGTTLDAGSADAAIDAATPPAVRLTNPVDGATDVALDATVLVSFTKAIDSQTVDATSFTLEDSAGDPVSGTITTGEADATFTPDAPLLHATTYTARVTTAVTDSAGTPLAADYAFSFTTRPRHWTDASLVETDQAGNGWYPDVAMDDAGNTIAVWYLHATYRDIWASRYVPGIGWGAPELLETTDADAIRPKVAMAANGAAMAVWTQPSNGKQSIWANHYVPGSGWQGATLLETDDAATMSAPRVTMTSTGGAFAVWEWDDSTNSHVYVARYTPGGGWETPQVVSSVNNRGSSSPKLAVDAAGNAVATWVQSDGTEVQVWANRYVAGTGWGTAEIIGNGAGRAWATSVASDGAGNVLAVWPQTDTGRQDLWANRYDAVASSWGTPVLVETNDTGSVSTPTVAMNAQGDAVAVWDQAHSSGEDVWASRYVDGSWTTPTMLETMADGNARNAQVTVDATGDAVVVWQMQDAGATYDMWASQYDVGTGWSAPRLLEDNENDATSPALAGNPAGDATAVWYQSDGTINNIWAARFE